MLDAELVKASDGTALWGQKYTRKLTDIIALEQEIARDLCAEVRLKVAPAAPHASKPEAHAAYLRGCAEVRHETAQRMLKGIEHFHHAMEVDPEYALPYAALALVHGRAVRVGLAPMRESVRQQVALANNALALDEALPEAHWDLALAALLVEDMAEYERRVARVLELNPNFAPAHVERANQLVLAERYEEAEAAHQYARTLDPLSPRVLLTYAAHLGWMRQFERADELNRATMEQFPESINARAYCALVTAYAFDEEEGLAMILGVPTDANPMFDLFKGMILAWNGKLDEARAIAQRTDELAKSRYVVPFYRAALHTALGNTDTAFALIEHGIREGDYWFRWLPYVAGFDPLRSDPRFAEMLRMRAATTGVMPRVR
jgi:tetratricopeptide (TPR) repeat protein